MGFTVKLMAPQFVKPYVKRQKNDANDAAAICEAMSRPDMRFVPVKTVAQADIQAVHRIRHELVSQRTAKANQIRGLLAEYRLIVPQRIEQLHRALPSLHDDETNGLSDRFQRLLGSLWQDLRELDNRIQELDREVANKRQSVCKPFLASVLLPLPLWLLLSAMGDSSSVSATWQRGWA